MLQRIHHAAIICADYTRSKHFYVETLGLKIVAEHYREERKSFKLDLQLPDGAQIELFSFENAPARPSYPEAQGLRHLAFVVADVGEAKRQLEAKGIAVEAIRVDEYTDKRFVFFADPDGLPLELYEADGKDAGSRKTILALGRTAHDLTESAYQQDRASHGEPGWEGKQRLLLADMALHLLQTSLKDGELSLEGLRRNLFSILTISDQFIEDVDLKAVAEELY
jgi:glyoxylase I family protein